MSTGLDPNYPLIYPKYLLLRTIRALLEGHLGGPGTLSNLEGTLIWNPKPQSDYYRWLNNYLYYFLGGFLL